MIRDISYTGVFVVAGVTPELNAHIDVHVYLPSLETRGEAVQLHGEGTIVRVDREVEGTKGFAATVAFRTEIASGTSVVNPKRVN